MKNQGWLAKLSLVCILIADCVVAGEEVTAEMLFGDYRSDPLFGQAAAQTQVEVTIEHQRLKPASVKLTANQTVRFLLHNETSEPHLMVLTDDLARVLSREDYIHSFHDEELMRRQSAGTHSHESNSTAEDAAPIVRQVTDDPALYISAGKSKEMLLSIPGDRKIGLYCVLDGHEKTGYHLNIDIESAQSQP